ncbi:MAG: molecular chaperone HtpG [Deferribacteraceae bacterium]|jgi:molecular chaperone HtpG|nr:molecular chaperone HtpG [Deferribacteraceae bacterium]
MAVEKKEFQTEVSQILNIVIHSLYSNKEIFLRELISNASDAIDKAAYEGLTDSKIYEGGTDWKIKIAADPEAKTITISDNGIGMTRDEMIKSLGTIAHSGTKEFLKQLQEANKADGNISNLIGQFGVGFYSAFMVADHVSVISRKRGTAVDSATRWESDAQSSYTVEEASKEAAGTEITLHLTDENENLLKDWELRRIVGTYSDYISYPIVMDSQKAIMDSEGKETGEKETVEETLNSMKALWLKDKAEVSAEEQEQFYKHITHDYEPATATIQFKVEGSMEFAALLFIPAHAPFNLFHADATFGPMLYVKRVQIMEHCEELVPQYLRFLTGVVESGDLPLNISREILQNNRHMSVMQKNIVRKTLDALADMQRDEPEKYGKFFKEFGKVLKEGIHYDHERRETIAKLALFESTATKAGDTTTLDDYISRMKAEQKDIYYITGASRRELENSPYLETLKEKELEVLFMTDEVDDIIFGGLHQYKEHTFKSVMKGDLELDKDVAEAKAKDYEVLLKQMKEALGDKVESIRLTTRLKSSPACLVVGANALDPQMERMMRAMGQMMPPSKRILEINPDHALIVAMNKELGDDAKLKEYAGLIYDQALLLEGEKIEDPAGFVQKISAIMARV